MTPQRLERLRFAAPWARWTDGALALSRLLLAAAGILIAFGAGCGASGDEAPGPIDTEAPAGDSVVVRTVSLNSRDG